MLLIDCHMIAILQIYYCSTHGLGIHPSIFIGIQATSSRNQKMNFKFKSALAAIVLLAMGAAHADYSITGTINSLRPTVSDGNASVWISMTGSGSCGGNGPLAILRMGNHMGSGGSADKTYSNFYSVLLAAKLAGKSVTANVDDACSLKEIVLSN
jgi:hypothetical protein